MNEKPLPGECYFCGRTWRGRVVPCVAPETHPELAIKAKATFEALRTKNFKSTTNTNHKKGS